MYSSILFRLPLLISLIVALLAPSMTPASIPLKTLQRDASDSSSFNAGAGLAFSPQALVTDEFSVSSLGTHWTWADPDNDGSYSLTANPGWLRLITPYGDHITPRTDYWYQNCNAGRVMQTATGDFTVETKVVLVNPADSFQYGGILVFLNKDNYVMLNRGYSYGNNLGAGWANNSVEGSINATSGVSSSPTWLRMERVGNDFSFFYSSDGTNWQTLGTKTLDNLPNTIQVGLVAGYSNNQVHPDFKADFDYFRVTTPQCGASGPTDVMLVIDRSNSMSGTPLADEKVAAKGFVDRMNLAQDQVGLASFASDAVLNRQLTHDGNAVKSAIDALASSGTTNMAGGINSAQTELQSTRHNTAARPVMILMSDGQPDSDSAAISAAQTAKNAGTRIFTIGLGSADANLMRQLASSSADYYYAPTSADLAAIYQAIAGAVTCSQAKIKVSPASKRVPVSSGNFTVDIVAQDVTNLGAYQTELTYNSSIVNVVSVALGPFLGSTGRTVSPVGPVIDNSVGKVTFGAFTFGSQPGVNGTGVLATITLQPKAKGTSALHLQNLQAADPNSNPIAGITTEDGQVEIVSCLGDFDGDNDVDIFDLQRAASHWNCRTGQACYDVQFDTEPDGDIDVFDLQRFAAAWGTQCTIATAEDRTLWTEVFGSQGATNMPSAVRLGLVPASAEVAISSQFTLTVRIQDAPAIGAFQTDLVFDPSIIRAETVTIGAFLGSTGRSVTPVGPAIDNAAGRVTFGAFTFGSQAGASGIGDLAFVRFRAQGLGQSALSFQQTGVSDTQGNPVYLGGLEGSTVKVGDQLQKRVYLPLVLR